MSRKTGIVIRHSRTCATQANRDARCTCAPSYRAEVYDRRSRKKVRKTFHNLSEAKGWRHDAASALRKGTLAAPTKRTLHEAAAAWLEGARAGIVRTRSGDRYKPSAIRAYDQALRGYVLPDLGALRLSEIQRRDVQRLADELLAGGRDPSTIRNALMPLRVIFRRALEDGDVAVNPTEKLRLPAIRGKRDRVAPPDEAVQLLAALSARDRAIWATALYAGLRRGELMALRVEDVDLARGLIRVDRAFDPKERVFVEPKSRAGRRSVPIASVLRDYLDEHKLRLAWSDGLFFGRTAGTPFDDSSLSARAVTAWKNAEPLLDGITLHEARHTFASLMIGAGVNAKALSTYLGHSSVSITYDRYGHLMPGNEDESAALLDAYLQRATTTAELARLAA
jgi:integrase